MPHTILWQEVGKRAFEFRTAIGLDDLHRSGEAAGHRGVQERDPILTRQSGPQDYVRLFGIDIHSGEGNHLAKVHGIHLNDCARDRRSWYAPRR